MIPVFRPSLGDEEIEAVSDVMRSGWIGLGPRTAEFEERFAAFCRVPHAVALNSGTAALDLAMKLLDIGPGDEVIVPTITFVSTAHVVAHNLGTPIFADVDPQTLNIDLEDVARKLTSRTRAIVVVHYGGRPVDIDGIRAIAGDIPLIEDCAHATGALYRCAPVGGLGTIGCFSFHAVKNLTTGDGGMLTTHNAAWADRARSLRWLGIDRSTWQRTEGEAPYAWEYTVAELGLKSHMNDIAAAIGLVQLQRLDALNGRRRAIMQRYREALADIEQIELPLEDDRVFRSSWHMFVIKCDRRDQLSDFLARHDVATGVHYAPIHRYACYGDQPGLPVAESVFKRLLTLPLFPDLPDDQVDRIVGLIRRYYHAA